MNPYIFCLNSFKARLICILLVMVVLKRVQMCNIASINCKCNRNIIDCKENMRGPLSIDFSELNTSMNGLNLTLNIYSKNIIEIKTSNENQITNRIENVLFSNCNIAEITTNSLKGLTSLKRFSLSSNNIGYFNIDQDVYPVVKLEGCQIYKITSIPIIHSGALVNCPWFETTISIYEKQVEIIETNAFDHKQDLKVLNLHSNRIKKIQNGSFKNLFKLEDLFLYLNEIDLIENGSFDSLLSLKRLVLFSNRIKTIQKDLFRKLSNLISLELNHNYIESLESYTFYGLTNLTKLNLFLNKIKTIHRDTFKNLTRLAELFLHKNELNSIEFSLSSLSKLLLGSNKMVRLEKSYFLRLSNLDKLHIQENRVSEIESDTFEHLVNLTNLSLASNKIQQINRDLFKNLRKLTFLDLEKNEIFCIETNAFESLENLQVLKLTSNRIKRIERKLFTNLINLEQLMLNENEINSIEEDTFASIKNLTELHLNSNRISDIEKIGLGSALANLKRLFLSYNSIFKIKPNSISHMASLVILDLAHNYLDGFNNCTFLNLNFNGHLVLDFNYIVLLERRFFVKSLYNLKELYMRSNRLSRIEDFSFGNLGDLEKLYLDSNSLVEFGNNTFFNLTNLKYLSLSFNRIKAIHKISLSLSHLVSLKGLDLYNNSIEYVSNGDFRFTLNLQSINLSLNLIKTIEFESFRFLKHLNSLKISKTNISLFNVDLLVNCQNITELDVSFNRLNLNGFDRIGKNIEYLKLGKVSLFPRNISLSAMLLSSKIKTLDMSDNFIDDFSVFNILVNLTSFELRNVNLKSMRQIGFASFQQLKYLDLSFNNLTELLFISDDFLKNVEHLNLSFNYISTIEPNFFYSKQLNQKKNLKYLNLEHNRIFFFESELINYESLDTLILSNNVLNQTLRFNCIGDANYVAKNRQFFFNDNNVTIVEAFSLSVNSLELLNFDSNQIESLKENTFSDLRSLKTLSISKNLLKNITKNNFFHLYSLQYLNLSFNQISTIEFDSFVNLNKLISLDLSFNNLYSIENGIFNGLTYLNRLYLQSDFEIDFENFSLSVLENIGYIYLNASIVIEYKCFFVNFSSHRHFTRYIKDKYKFYKSLNLITESQDMTCDLVFHFLQFKIHLNLEIDYDIERFYQRCEEFLIKKSNSFKKNENKCFLKQTNQYENSLNEDEPEMYTIFSKIFTNYAFYLIMCPLLSLLGPVFYMINQHFWALHQKEISYSKFSNTKLFEKRNLIPIPISTSIPDLISIPIPISSPIPIPISSPIPNPDPVNEG
jgi:Leucine-rich repeat (LRR) protein